MKVIIAGSRHIHDYLVVAHAVAKSGWRDEITQVVSGKARGVDTCGIHWAVLKDIPVRAFPADWDTYGNAAGPIRNEQMAEYADALILIWDGKSKGSAGMKRLAKARGLRIFEHIVTE